MGSVNGNSAILRRALEASAAAAEKRRGSKVKPAPGTRGARIAEREKAKAKAAKAARAKAKRGGKGKKGGGKRGGGGGGGSGGRGEEGGEEEEEEGTVLRCMHPGCADLGFGTQQEVWRHVLDAHQPGVGDPRSLFYSYERRVWVGPGRAEATDADDAIDRAIGQHRDLSTRLVADWEAGTQDKLYYCSWPACSYTTDFKALLILHDNFHTPGDDFVCKWYGCHYTCGFRSSLRSHLRAHQATFARQLAWVNVWSQSLDASHPRVSNAARILKANWTYNVRPALFDTEPGGSSRSRRRKRDHDDDDDTTTNPDPTLARSSQRRKLLSASSSSTSTSSLPPLVPSDLSPCPSSESRAERAERRRRAVEAQAAAEAAAAAHASSIIARGVSRNVLTRLPSGQELLDVSWVFDLSLLDP